MAWGGDGFVCKVLTDHKDLSSSYRSHIWKKKKIAMVACICNSNLRWWISAKLWCSWTSLSSLLRLVKDPASKGGGGEDIT